MNEGFPKGPEKRNYQRLELELPVRLEANGKEIHTSTENISCGGMFLPAKTNKDEAVLKEEDKVVAFITIPDECKVVRLSGNIKRIERNKEFYPVGIAVQFSGLYDDNHLEIDRYLKQKLIN